MVVVRLKSPAKLDQFLDRHGEGEGHIVRFKASFAVRLSEARAMLAILKSKVKTKGWSVRDMVHLRTLIEIDDALRETDVLLADLIALTEPIAVLDTVPGRLRHPGRHVGLPLRIVGLGSTGPRRNGHAALTTGPSVPVFGRAYGFGRWRNASRTAPSVGGGVRNSFVATRFRYARSRRRAGRRHRLPRIVPAPLATKLLQAGNHLQGCYLLRVQDIGEALAAVGLSLLRQKDDRATLHAHLLRVKGELMDIWAAEVRLADVM